MFSCGTAQFKSILEYLSELEDEMGVLKERIRDYMTASEEHEERCTNDDIITTNKLSAMNDKVKYIILNISF